jgi:hypothetical protein
VTAKKPRPSVIDAHMIGGPTTAEPAQLGRPEPARAPGGESQMFRTSVYFHRKVHDKLRDIAHAERKSVADLIHEGLDVVLNRRNFPTTSQLKDRDA